MPFYVFLSLLLYFPWSVITVVFETLVGNILGKYTASARKTRGRSCFLGWVIRRSSHHFRQETLPSPTSHEWWRLWGISSNCYDYDKCNEITITLLLVPFSQIQFFLFIVLAWLQYNCSLTLTSNSSSLLFFRPNCVALFLYLSRFILRPNSMPSGKSTEFLDTRKPWRDSYSWTSKWYPNRLLWSISFWRRETCLLHSWHSFDAASKSLVFDVFFLDNHLWRQWLSLLFRRDEGGRRKRKQLHISQRDSESVWNLHDSPVSRSSCSLDRSEDTGGQPTRYEERLTWSTLTRMSSSLSRQSLDSFTDLFFLSFFSICDSWLDMFFFSGQWSDWMSIRICFQSWTEEPFLTSRPSELLSIANFMLKSVSFYLRLFVILTLFEFLSWWRCEYLFLCMHRFFVSTIPKTLETSEHFVESRSPKLHKLLIRLLSKPLIDFFFILAVICVALQLPENNQCLQRSTSIGVHTSLLAVTSFMLE
jgi:hypothetical protein